MSLLAETPTGTITVHVTDAGGDAVPGASVKAKNQDTGKLGTCTTEQKDGSCPIPELPAGLYDVEVSSPGFKTLLNKNVRVEISKTTKVDAEMQPGRIDETVTVTAEVTALELEGAPLGARNFSTLLALIPGSIGSSGWTNIWIPTSTLSTSLAKGSRPGSDVYFLDGASIRDRYSSVLLRNQEETSIARIVPTGTVGELGTPPDSSAEFGGYSGSILNTSSRSGGNMWHGDAFEIFSNDVLNARDFFDSTGPKNKLRYNNFGATLGGPLKRDKVFFFAAYEAQREALETTTITSVPRPSDFTAAVATLGGNPAIPIPLNPVVNPVIRNLFSVCQATLRCPGGSSLWPAPSPELAGTVLDSAAPAPTQRRLESAFLGLTYVASGKDNFSSFYDFYDGKQNAPVALDGANPLPSTNTLTHLHAHLGNLSYTRYFSPERINTLRLSWHRYSTSSLDEDALGIGDPNRSIGLDTGVVNSRDFGLPQLRISGLAFLGSSPFANPLGRTEIDWQLAEQFVLTRGRHKFKFGYDFDHTNIHSFNDTNYRGLLEFNSLADFLAGRVASGSISSGNSTRVTSQVWHALYLQDTYRLTSTLTADLAIRWDYFAVLREKRGLLTKYDPALGLISPRNIYPPDAHDFGPRLALSWEPKHLNNTVLGATFGIFYDVPPQDVFMGQVEFNTFNPGIAYNPSVQQPILTSHSPSGVLQPGLPVFPASTFANDTRDVSTLGDIRTPYAIRYGLNAQQQLFSTPLVIQISFAGSQGHRLFRVRDINAPSVPGGLRPLATAAPLSTVAPNTPFIANQIETSAASNFNSLQLILKQPSPWHGWQNYAFWTWSHSIDDASSGIDWIPNIALPNNSRFPNQERASSSFDQRHRFLWQSIYDFPHTNNNQWLDGWQLAGTLVLKSGQPYNINFADEFDTQGAYDFILRPDLVGNPFIGVSAPDRLLNLAAFAVPCTLDGLGTTAPHCLPGTLHYGNLPRNAFVSPSLGKLDLALSKQVRFGERLNLRLRAGAFNVLNNPIFASPLFPRYIALASLKGIGLSGRGGSAGSNCNTTVATSDCYLQSTVTPNGVNYGSFLGDGNRSIQLSARFSF